MFKKMLCELANRPTHIYQDINVGELFAKTLFSLHFRQ
jgi:hypothetical protein